MCIIEFTAWLFSFLLSDSYDAIVTCAAFMPGQLNQSCFPEMVRIVKSGMYKLLHEYK